MKKNCTFLASGAVALALLAIIVIIGACFFQDNISLKAERIDNILAHGELITAEQTEEHEIRQYLYNNNDNEVCGQEVKNLLVYLDKCFPEQLSYAANGTDYERYSPKENAKFKWGLIWVTPQNELIKLVLTDTDITGRSAILVKLGIEKNALIEINAEVTEKTDDTLWVKTEIEAEPVQVIWDCDGAHFTNPVNKLDYNVGDSITLWLNPESTESAGGNCIFVVKVE